ncbi:probable G-protein coupled receptor 156 [Antedon mediterranea]|uniref:probable G-protein coupled receptor 156 n=1 Tax=Antedon mediterranea TaxID=105859 RepID=UPI003AF5A069
MMTWNTTHVSSSDDVDEVTVSLILFGIVCSLSVAGIGLAIFFMTFNIRYRRNRIVKMSSPNLNVIMQFGAIVLYACPVLFGIEGVGRASDNVLAGFCQARVWCLAIGFTLVYGTIFSKSWRVHTIFKSAGVKRTVIRDEKLLLIILVMLLIDIGILSMWTLLDPLTHTLVPISSQATLHGVPSNNLAVNQCQSEFSAIWLLLFFTYKSVTLIFGTFLSWSTRNVVLPSMNEARCIVISIYTCVVLVALAMGISTVVWMWPNIWFSVVTTVIFTCTTEVLLLQNVPKMKAWKENPQANLSRAITASYLACSGNASFNQIEEELFLLSAENVALKKSLSEKEERIKMMQEHVENARDKLKQLQVDDVRQDSGCDVDMSSSSTGNDDVIGQTGTGGHENQHRDQPEPGSSLILNGLARTESLDRFSNVKKRVSHDRNSLRSINSAVSGNNNNTTNNFAELKHSIAKNLHVAHTLSSTLRSSIAEELNSCRKRPMYHEIASTERDIAHAFQQSYNFENEDVLSVISSGSVFTYDNPVFMRGSDFRLSGSSYYTSRTSRHSSFRSIASFASDFTDKSRSSSVSRKLKLPRYIAPQQDHLIPPQIHEVPKIVKIEMMRSTGKMNSTYV